MIILTIRTDKPDAEVGLFDGEKQLAYESWTAHRELAETIHTQIAKNLQILGKDWSDIEGIACYQGPGSFTGLRIGLTVANTLAYALSVPIVGATGDDWKHASISALVRGENQQTVLPQYGGEPHTTPPKK